MNKLYSKIMYLFQSERMIEKALILFFFLYLYTIYDLFQFIMVSIFIMSLTITLKFEAKKFKNKGLIHYLPSPLQTLLTKSSVFDIFTFFWNPNFFLYLKTFYKPFFQNISPEEAIKNLDELPLEAKNAILTKGIVYSLPPLMKQMLLPQSIYQEIQQREEDEKRQQQEKTLQLKEFGNNISDQECDNINYNQNEIRDPNNSWGVVSSPKNKKLSYDDQRLYKSVIEEEDLLHLTEEKQSQLYKISQKSTLNFHKGIQDDYNSYQADQLNRFKFEDKRINNRVDSIRKLMMMEQPIEIKTKVIASSKDLAIQQNGNQKIGERKNEDNFEDSIHNMLESIKMRFNNSSNDSAMGQIKNAVNLLMGVAEIKKNTNMLHKIETTRIYKLFVMSAIFLLSQYFISKKTRRWLISSTMFAAYILSFFLTFGTMGIFIYKNVSQQQITPSNQLDNDKLNHLKRKNKKKLQKQSCDDGKYLVDDSQI